MANTGLLVALCTLVAGILGTFSVPKYGFIALIVAGVLMLIPVL